MVLIDASFSYFLPLLLRFETGRATVLPVNDDEALRAAGEMQDIFGKDNFFIEIMDHGLNIENRNIPGLLEIAKKLNAPLLATNDSHYVHAEDAEAQDAMLCINSGSHLDDPDRFKFDGTGYYLKPAEEMRGNA